MQNYKGLGSVLAVGELCQFAGSLPAVTEVRILFSHRDWETGALSFLMITLQRNGFQILDKDTPRL